MAWPGSPWRSAPNGRWVRLLSMVATLALLLTGTLAATFPGPSPSAAALAQVQVDEDESDQEVYDSPTYGFTLEYDPEEWEIDQEESDENGDFVTFLNGPSFVTLSATGDYDGNPEECFAAWVESLAAGSSVEDFAPLEDEDGEPIEDEGDDFLRAAFAFSSEDGDQVFDLECRVLIEDQATLAIVLETFEDQYEDQLDARDDLLEGLDVSDVQSSGGRSDEDGDDEAGGEPSVIEDDFEDEDDGLFSTESPESDLVRFAYDDGEFVMETLDSDAGGWQAGLSGQYLNVEIEVDVRIVGRTRGRYVTIGCRYGQGSAGVEEGPSLLVEPDTQRVMLYFWEGDEIVSLYDETGNEAVNPDEESNHLELRCADESIEARVNGELVAEVEDDDVEAGTVSLGAGTYSDSSGTVEARWDNFVLRVLDGAVPEDEGDGSEDDRADGDEDGQVVREDFEDEDEGLVSPSESETVRYTYDDGEFVIEWLPEDSSGSAVTMFFPSDAPVADVVAAADVRLADETDGRSVMIGCREGIGPNGDSGAYRMVVEPDSRRMAIVRIEGFEAVVLAEETRVPDVNRGDEVNRIELSCVGETLEASVNGEVVLTVEDDTYEEGMLSLGIEIASDAAGPAEARWDNLEITVID